MKSVNKLRSNIIGKLIIFFKTEEILIFKSLSKKFKKAFQDIFGVTVKEVKWFLSNESKFINNQQDREIINSLSRNGLRFFVLDRILNIKQFYLIIDDI
jgi:hypothetical protein